MPTETRSVNWQFRPVVYVLSCEAEPGLCKVGRASSWWGSDVRAAQYSTKHGLGLLRFFTATTTDLEAAKRLEQEAHSYLRHLKVQRGGARELFTYRPALAADLLRRRAKELDEPIVSTWA